MNGTDLLERLERVRYTREDWHEPYGAIDLPCDADDFGAQAHPINPDGPEAAALIRTLQEDKRRLEEALEEIAHGLALPSREEIARVVKDAHARKNAGKSFLDETGLTFDEIADAILTGEKRA